jgi:hypothetical protein
VEDVGVDGRIIVKRILRSGKWCMDWSDLAEDRDRRRALMNAVMNLRAS